MSEDCLSRPPVRSPQARSRSKDKALLVGIQYDNPASDDVAKLKYPHRDIDLFKKYLEDHEGYEPRNIVVLVDRKDQPPEAMPTKQNIVRIYLLRDGTQL